MDRCPNCRARDPGQTQCRRCGMELSPLTAVEDAAERLIRCALTHLAAGDARAAAANLSQARALRSNPFIGLLLGFAVHRNGTTSATGTTDVIGDARD